MADDDKTLNPAVTRPAGEAYGDGTPSFAGFPVTKWHPEYGAKTVNDPNEAAKVFQPPHNWFDNPGSADMARTDTEAQRVILQGRMRTMDAQVAINNGGEAVPLTGPDAPKGIVLNSVQAQESIDAGKAEPI